VDETADEIRLSPRLASAYADLAEDFGARQPQADWSPVEHEMLKVIDIEKLLAVEGATVEKGKG
jgi:hypothetical protein